MSNLDKLIYDISQIYEVNRAEELSIYLKIKYNDIFAINSEENDPYINEFLDCLNELSNLSNIISTTFLRELKID